MEVLGQEERQSLTLHICNLEITLKKKIKTDAYLLKLQLKWIKDFLQGTYNILLAATDGS